MPLTASTAALAVLTASDAAGAAAVQVVPGLLDEAASVILDEAAASILNEDGT